MHILIRRKTYTDLFAWIKQGLHLSYVNALTDQSRLRPHVPQLILHHFEGGGPLDLLRLLVDHICRRARLDAEVLRGEVCIK